MRIACPHCGERDRREFTPRGHALACDRPDPTADEAVWDDYLHNRENPAGWIEELWHHAPCGTWLIVERHTATHEIRGARAAVERV